MITDFFGGGHQFGLSIEYVVQQKKQGIGQALSLCEKMLDKKPFLLVYGDALTDFNPILSLLQTYSETNREISLVALPHGTIKEFIETLELYKC